MRRNPFSSNSLSLAAMSAGICRSPFLVAFHACATAGLPSSASAEGFRHLESNCRIGNRPVPAHAITGGINRPLTAHCWTSPQWHTLHNWQRRKVRVTYHSRSRVACTGALFFLYRIDFMKRTAPQYPSGKTFFCDNSMFRTQELGVHGVLYDNYEIPRHSHAFTELNLVVAGKGHHFILEHAFPVKAGDVFVIPPHVQHAYSRE